MDEEELATLCHIFLARLLLDRVVVGSSFWGSGAEWTPVVRLLDHELLLLPVEEFKEYVVDPDAELDFSRSDIDPSFHTVQKRSSKDEV